MESKRRKSSDFKSNSDQADEFCARDTIYDQRNRGTSKLRELMGLS
jgi:hypothetical protein